jgi:hypothetical protein
LCHNDSVFEESFEKASDSLLDPSRGDTAAHAIFITDPGPACAKSAFARECLGEYCQYQYNNAPLFRTMGMTRRSTVRPTANQLQRHLNQIPENFEMCCKVREEFTIPVYAQRRLSLFVQAIILRRLLRNGRRNGAENVQ